MVLGWPRRGAKGPETRKKTNMPDLGPAALIIIAFLIAVYGLTGFAGREPSQDSGE